MHPLYADGRAAPVVRQLQPDRPDPVPRNRGALRRAVAVNGGPEPSARPAGRGTPAEAND